ncbi:VWA domain-containing protein [Streptomyces solisilvae]|uniref:prealbumin-like fold domain-containing protein n=1 Tax=Streptomyces malaysiensis TaxID=92644 RepID=UPI0036CD4E2D
MFLSGFIRSRLRGCLTASVLGVLCGLVLVSGPGGAAVADVPDPTDSTAVVNVSVGADRDTATTITPLAGVTFGLFSAQPTEYEPFDGYTTGTPLYTCVSDADGDCSVEVPVGAGGITPGTRLWVAPVAGPSGWYANPVFQTAPLTGAAGRVQTRHVFQTPPLYAGQTYRSGSGGFMSDPGTQTTPPSTISQYTTRVASGGVWPLSRVNPDLPTQCGLKVAFVVDLSASVQGSVTALKSAADSFVDALRGTPSQAALFTFSTDSPAVNAGPNSGLMPVATTADANRFKQLYSGWTESTANGYTNWDRGLGAVAAVNESDDPDEHFDLAIVLTDGNPTAFGPQGPGYPQPAGFTRFREMENAIASANRVKAEDTRIVSVGVGDGLDQGATANLRAISGRTAYDGTDIAEADFIQAADYAEVGRDLHDLVLSACAPSISVIKQIVPHGGTADDAYTPAEGWQFTAEPDNPAVTVTPTSGTTSPQTGALNFDLAFEAEDSPAGVTVAEDPQTAQGYTPFPVDGQNAVCVNKSEDDAPVEVTNSGTTGFHVDVGLQDAVSCVVLDQAPDVNAASVVIHKRWQVTTAAGTQTYEEGDQPSDLQARLHLTGPGDQGAMDQPWSVERHGYRAGDSATVSEEVDLRLPGCTFEGGRINGPGADGVPLPADAPTADITLGAGSNEFTVTNGVDCRSRLTLVKEVVGDADPDAWILHAIAPQGALPGPQGTSGVSAEVTPDVTYQLAERLGSDDPDLLNYRQDDFRSDPSEHPDSTGSMDCAITRNGQPVNGFAQGADGSVVVPLGQDVTCTAVNRTAQLTLIKNVEGGDAAPGDFALTVTPVDPDPVGIPTQTVPGASTPGNSINVRPGQEYRITESPQSGYRLESVVCTIGDTTHTGQTLVIPAGYNALCTVTNSHEGHPKPPSGGHKPPFHGDGHKPPPGGHKPPLGWHNPPPGGHKPWPYGDGHGS